jgi:hypothetical protein
MPETGNTKMNDSIEIMLSELERDYYDGARLDALTARVENIVQAIAKMDPEEPIRQACEANAAALWGGNAGDPVSLDAVSSALDGDAHTAHLRAWSNFYKIVATVRHVA